MQITQWLPSVISAGLISILWWMIKRSLDKSELRTQEEFKKMWREVGSIKHEYMTEDKHILICGKSALEIEKIFKECLGKTKDEIFTKLRDLEIKMNNKNDKM